MKTLFNHKIKVIQKENGKFEFQGNVYWVDFVDEIMEDINDFPNSGSNVAFKQVNHLIEKHFIGDDIRTNVKNYFIRNGCSNDLDVYNKMKEYEFVKGFCGMLGNLILLPLNDKL